MEDNFGWNGEIITQEKTLTKGRTKKVKGIPLPKTLDYSFLANIFEVGDEIQYTLRVLSNELERSDPSLITDAVITLINLGMDGKTTFFQLNNGNNIINSLHLV